MGNVSMHRAQAKRPPASSQRGATRQRALPTLSRTFQHPVPAAGRDQDCFCLHMFSSEQFPAELQSLHLHRKIYPRQMEERDSQRQILS